MQEQQNIFDRSFYKKRREIGRKNFANHNFLFREVSKDLEDRIELFSGHFYDALLYGPIYMNDTADNVTRADIAPNLTTKQNLHFFEEDIPLKDCSFDLIISNLSLHFINNIQDVLLSYRKLLRKDGLFIATLFGGKTLIQLRETFEKVEIKLKQGISPRVIPFIDIKDGALLMSRAGFQEIVCDLQTYNIQYKNFMNMIQDIRGMGQSNPLISRNTKHCGKEFFKTMGENFNYDTITFEVLTLTGRNIS